MQSFLNNIGNWLLTNVWDVTSDALFKVEPLTASVAFGVFIVIVMLSISGVLSRITDFIISAGLISFIVILASVPVGLMLSAPAESFILIFGQTIVLALVSILFIGASAITILALYYGKPHSNIAEFFAN